MSIALQIAGIEQRVQAACDAAGRERSSVRLLAATKTVEADRMREAIAAGLVIFGESRAQELRDKIGRLQAHVPLPEWHFIGHLQRNKIRYLVGRVALLHTVDDIGIAQAISQRLERDGLSQAMSVLVQVNLGNERSKAGVAPEHALELCRQLQGLSRIDLCGLMAIPPWSPDSADSRPHFEALAALALRGREQGLPLTELSMGMSHDFEAAIEYGATIIRIGRAIFGERPPPSGARR